MELLNNQEKELLSRYNKYISNTRTQETIKYSDIFVGKHDIGVGQLRDEMKFQNTKMGIKSSSVTNRDEFKNIMSEMRNNQIQKRESEKKSKNKNSQHIEDNSKQKQFEQNQKLVIKECVDKPEKQVRQKSALSQDYPELKKRSDRISSKQTTMDIQKQFNEKLLQQLERLIQMKKIDSKFFFCLIKRHIEECPQFGKRVKEEIKELLNQLL
ncbi:unnamed protein product (macronuclear) [Paramecium tetraurelia]|uniref:Uncharacterized protein n=1 Tax=Paramecium tetraurelia TaxID=5888 RepID=A0BZ06_PARTE|nr:uncharacterized protein GSPATT00033626001 [Paramecium tetraurelia]CAK63773.1 unnamed protein product [Paramecium tetraurelia]|eukprot:XP_001431171.1 hypothetical protein (macronuclear) [Paramecium tetraurelia strain d4-2]